LNKITFNFIQNFNNMSQLLLNKMKNLAGVSALLVAFFFVSTLDAKAQSVSRAATGNPYGLIAQKLGVVTCNPGTATNVQGGLAALQAQTEALKPIIADGNAPILTVVKYEYYQMILSDVQTYSVAVEFASLTDLPRAAKLVGNESITNQQLAGLYNGVKTLFGMCQ